MAERNARIILKQTSVSGKVPTGTTGDESNYIKQGETAINTTDQKLYSFDGSNIFEVGSKSFLKLSGGTIGAINVSGTSYFNSLSATTLSGGTILSGTTNLYDIFATLPDQNDITRVQGGTNTFTGGTANAPSINITSATLANLSTSGKNVNYQLSATSISGSVIYFDINGTGTTQEGAAYWADGTLNLQTEFPEVLQQVGQEIYIKIKNTGVTINDGQVVYLSGAQGQQPIANLASASSHTSSHVLGVATHQILSNAQGYITVLGRVNGINTSSFNEGDTLYLSETLGQLTNIQPVAPNHRVDVATVIVSHASNGSILVKTQQAVDLDDITEFLYDQTPVDGQVFVYSGSSQVFVNRKLNISDLGVSAHTHNISEINNLSGSLDTKANLSGATFTGGIVALSLSATTLSGGTIYSGNTNIYSIFAKPHDIPYIQNGLNTFTGGTTVLPTINITSATLANLSTSGTNVANSFSATTLSGGTIYSGSTNLQSTFNSFSSEIGLINNQLPTKANLSGATFTGGIVAPSLSATSISASSYFQNSQEIKGTIYQSTSPNLNPYSANTWVDTVDGFLTYQYDSGRGKWLSTFENFFEGSRGTANASGLYLRRGDSVPYNTVPFVAPYDMTIVRCIAQCQTSSSWIGVVLTGTTLASDVVYRIVSTTTTYTADTSVNVDVTSGQTVYLYMSGTSIPFPYMNVYYKKKNS